MSDERLGGRGPRSANEVSVREERIHRSGATRRGDDAKQAEPSATKDAR